ncbi:hypothetical protein QBC34DRAFT_387173 [Podospora aff. communis PSN243]|uniref:2EXR domain-containing protein n=1 Tax=Podospora aff. communis PSN243 TaxID=3040156 RepID=A0AAV9G5P7_9PEZI|nr:hypothetical protein QBC34DRAFT_387173 [Podospora aff. communis PSN243]
MFLALLVPQNCHFWHSLTSHTTFSTPSTKIAYMDLGTSADSSSVQLASTKMTTTADVDSSAPTIITKFPQFGQLPRELRDMIWDFAIRPKGKRGAHTFTLINLPSTTTKQRNEWSQYCALAQNPIPGHTLAAPSLPEGWQAPGGYRREPQPSWHRANSSTYLVDSGLWVAYKESREAMLKRFRGTELYESRRPVLPNPQQTEVEIIDSRAWTVAFSDKEKPQYFTLYPMSDLFIVLDFSFSWTSWSVFDLFEQMPLFQQTSGTFMGHIAFELGPYSKNKVEDYFASRRMKRILNALVVAHSSGVLPSASRTVRVEGGATSYPDTVKHAASTYLWFIDRTLPLAEADTDMMNESESFVFYGQGCKYVEVQGLEITKHGLLGRFQDEFLEITRLERSLIGGCDRWMIDRIGILRCEPWAG